jgi:type I restriction enzyme M protein
MATEQRRTEELRNYAGLIWSIADSLRGPYKRSEYGHVILPLTLMRRLDQAMEDSKDAVVAEAERRREQRVSDVLWVRPGRLLSCQSGMRSSK